MASNPDYKIWQSANIVAQYLNGVSAAVPYKPDQLDVMVRMIEANGVKQSDPLHFLDIGCGDGILGATLLSRFPNSKGVLLDFSEPMLDAARDRLKVLAPQPAFIQSDYGDPAWVQQLSEHAPFDAIVSGFSIHHQPDDRKRRVYADIHGLLAPGGVFVNMEHVASRTSWGERMFDERFIDSLVQFHGQKGSGLTRDQIAAEFYNRADKKANVLITVDIQCEWLREIGFTDVDCFFKIFELAVFGGRKQP